MLPCWLRPISSPPEQHRHALGEEQGGEHVALHAVTGALYPDGVGRSLDAPVAAVVVVAPVAVVLAVGLVVLAVVADEVGQGEAVVAGDEVDAGVGAATARRVDVARAGEARGELGDHGRDRPARSGARSRGTPRSTRTSRWGTGPAGSRRDSRPRARRSSFDLREHGVLLDDLEEGTRVPRLVAPGQHGGEVEAEAVHVHVGHPVAQAVGDQSPRCKMLRLFPVPV